MQHGQVPVQHHDIVIRRRQPEPALAPVQGDIYRHPVPAQPPCQHSSQVLMILDHKHTHTVHPPAIAAAPVIPPMIPSDGKAAAAVNLLMPSVSTSSLALIMTRSPS